MKTNKNRETKTERFVLSTSVSEIQALSVFTYGNNITRKTLALSVKKKHETKILHINIDH